MDLSLGLSVPDDDNNDLNKREIDDDNDFPEVMTFPANCSHCNAPSDTKMHILNIPHFKEVVIMATNCDVSIFSSYYAVLIY
jgi:zinc finger protein